MDNIEKMTPQDSIALITDMIREVKGRVQRNSIYFLLWGWVIVIANLGMFTLSKTGFDRPYIVWLITIPAWIWTIYQILRRTRQSEARTHLDTVSTYLWIAFGVVIFTLMLFGARINYQLNAVILMITAIPTIVSGIIIRFRPFIAGAAVFWLGAIACFLVASEIQPLIAAMAIAGGYLVPGYMLKFQREQNGV